MGFNASLELTDVKWTFIKFVYSEKVVVQLLECSLMVRVSHIWSYSHANLQCTIQIINYHLKVYTCLITFHVGILFYCFALNIYFYFLFFKAMDELDIEDEKFISNGNDNEVDGKGKSWTVKIYIIKDNIIKDKLLIIVT